MSSSSKFVSRAENKLAGAAQAFSFDFSEIEGMFS